MTNDHRMFKELATVHAMRPYSRFFYLGASTSAIHITCNASLMSLMGSASRITPVSTSNVWSTVQSYKSGGTREHGPRRTDIKARNTLFTMGKLKASRVGGHDKEISRE